MQLDGDAFKLKRMMRQDAHEKAFEISMMAQRKSERERDFQIKQEAAQLRKEYEQKIENQNINFRIGVAQRTNATRLEKMKKRNQCMEDLRI